MSLHEVINTQLIILKEANILLPIIMDKYEKFSKEVTARIEILVW